VAAVIIWIGPQQIKEQHVIIYDHWSWLRGARAEGSFYYPFKSTGILHETGEMEKTTSPYWWLNSGGMLYIGSGVGKTIQGKLVYDNAWRLAFLKHNALDTLNGYQPQNIFRLVTKSKWQNLQQEVYFRITRDNLLASPNRSASNGLLLFNRYRDSDNLYYTGIRVDGAAVIKKKYRGTYHTLAYKKIFAGADYDRLKNPSLLPKNTWLGVRSVVKNERDGKVLIQVYTDINWTGVWTLVLEARDDGKSFGGSVIIEAAPAGIRTDFMDVTFDNYRIMELE
jgi:hypothetical protein